ncbi:MAG: MarR family transcriptional regulator [Proteobacteria bacterium]|nr:MarR family transcriptional regulator [Pseudomonadota bacterium]
MAGIGSNLSAGELLDRIGRITRGLQFVGGLSPAQWEALRYLARANRYSCNPSALARFLGATRGTISQTLIALEDKGYLRRLKGERDRRTVRLELTTAGVALLESDPLGEVEGALETLPTAEAAVLADMLGRVLGHLQRRLGGDAFGICEDCRLFSAEDAPGDPQGPHRCGLTGEPLSDGDKQRICVEFRADA